MDDYNQVVIAEFRQNSGVVGGPLEGVPLVLLTHRGRRSGTLRTNPLGYYEDGEQVILFASNMGAARHPDWFLNIVADPKVMVDRGTDRYEADAVVLQGPERQRTWEKVVHAKPYLVEHQQRAGSREIPLIALRRVG
jgi:deazaflavin-dependent oxidoreductase (nitroreductase family)